MSTLAKAAASLALVVLALVVSLGLLEGVLRAAPGLIGLAALTEFPPALRAEIARRRGLPTRSDRRCLGPANRHDGGPKLCLFAPGAEPNLSAESVDLEHGAVEHLPQDANGFCNPPEKAARPATDILLAGDSFTFCTNVTAETTFASRLEGALGRTTYNVGVLGIGPYEYVEILRRELPRWQPAMVVLNIYEGNDLRDAARFYAHHAKVARSSAEGRAGDDRETAPGLAKRLARASYALGYVGAWVEILEEWLQQWWDGRNAIDFRYRITLGGDQIDLNTANSDLDEVESARRLRAGDVSPALFDEALASYRDLAREHGFLAVVTYIPSAYTAYLPVVEFADPSVAKDVAALSRAQRDHLAEKTAELGLIYVDLTDALQAQLVDQPLGYFPGNVHLTAAGHRAITAILAPALAELLAQEGTR